MPGAARLRCKHSDALSVLDNYGLPPERISIRFGNNGEGWQNMRKRLPELSLLARRFLSKLALSTRQCGKHLWLLSYDIAVFPNVNRCSVHARHFSGTTGGTPHPTTDTGSKALRLLWRFTSSGHGPRSNNLGLDSEFSYIAQ